MFFLKAMYRQSKVQAELKAQCKNQSLVNAICHPLKSVEVINDCFERAYFKTRKDAAFLTVCNVLMSVISDNNFDKDVRKKAWLLLAERYERIDKDFEYRKNNFLLAADYEYALDEYKSLFD